MQKERKSQTEQEPDTLRMRHNRFDGFDIYSVELEGRKILFHKEVLPKPFIVANTFKVLGANGNLWLCENIETKQIHIGPDQSFENPSAEERLATSSVSPLGTDQSV